MGGEVSIVLKSSNRIEISRLVQVLLNFYRFWGPPRGWGWLDVGGVVRRCPPHTCTCTCMHARTCMHMHIWHHREFPGISPMGVAICMKLSCLPHMHMRVCAFVHVHVCGGTPNHLPTQILLPLTQQSRREPKTPKFNNSWTNQDNSILFKDSLPLNIPELI